MTTHKVYVDTENLSREQLEQLLLDKEEEIGTLKDNVEFLHSCLDDRDKSTAILQEENRKLKLHIEAKDKAYTALLKDYEELKEDNKRLRAEIEEWLNAIRQKI